MKKMRKKIKYRTFAREEIETALNDFALILWKNGFRGINKIVFYSDIKPIFSQITGECYIKRYNSTTKHCDSIKKFIGYQTDIGVIKIEYKDN